jgi:hypothetical protein
MKSWLYDPGAREVIAGASFRRASGRPLGTNRREIAGCGFSYGILYGESSRKEKDMRLRFTAKFATTMKDSSSMSRTSLR